MTGPVDLRLGRWQDVLADVECDALISDPPYSERTHAGALSSTGVAGVGGYAAWTDEDARAYVEHWSPRVRGWIVIATDDTLGPVLRAALEAAGRYTFALVPVLQHMPRITGDGPGSPGHFLAVARPRGKRWLNWGSLPCWYEAPRDGSIIRGGKPLGLMRAIVRDYSRPGDLVVDTHCGGGTTALACAIEGRRCLTAEVDPVTHELARARLAVGYTPDLYAGTAGAP